MPPWSGTARARWSAEGRPPAAEPAARNLLLEGAAGPNKDRGGAGLVDGDPRARHLGAWSPLELDELSRWIHHRYHDTASVIARERSGRRYDRVRPFVRDHAPGTNHWHHNAPFALRSTAQIAVSAVMKRTFWSGPPNVKLTVPDRDISPSNAPAGVKTWIPPSADA